MVFGDSVLNGGAQTDHEALATSVLARDLSVAWQTPVVVGHISVGSWGPGNWLAYAREYGWFDADAVVLVMSSHDTADNPTFAPLNPNTHPTEWPWTAVGEGVTRYLPRYLPALLPAVEEPEKPVVSVDPQAEAQGLGDLRAFLLDCFDLLAMTGFLFRHCEEAIADAAIQAWAIAAGRCRCR